MRSEAIRVKKPSWIRIVNPEPIRILDMTWRHGSHVRIEPGGVFRVIAEPGDPRDPALAMYQPPRAPSQQDDAPPDALTLYRRQDLLLLSEGQAEFPEPFEKPVPRWMKDGNAPAATVRFGDRAFVPCSRMVDAVPPHAVRELRRGGPYREEGGVELLNRLPERRPIRPGGSMTVFTFLGEAPRRMLKVRYRAADYPGDQCPSGHWFDVPEEEFLRMRDEYELLRVLDACERDRVRALLGSL